MGKKLRLEKVHVENLFGRFTYDINFNNGNNIAILIAPNGCGKTTIFKLIEFIFKPSVDSYRDIVNVPFNKCECTLSNEKVVVLQKRKHKTENSNKRFKYENPAMRFISGGKALEEAELILEIKGEKSELNLSNVIRDLRSHDAYPFYEEYLRDEEIDLDEDDIFDASPFSQKVGRSAELATVIRNFLNRNQCGLTVNFIRADRLHFQERSRENRLHIPGRYEEREQNPLEMIQEKTKQYYREIIDAYNNLQREMKDRLPRLYLESTNPTMSREEFVQRWETYVSNIKKYCEIGLLKSEQTILNMDELEAAYSKKPAFLTVYLEAFEKTLEPLEINYPRLKLFVDILNRRNRVTRKIIKYGEEGVVVTVDGEVLPLDYLSSGEKNDFIMFYNLIFDSEKKRLVLVDEPEISLHIEWQEEYLDCLIKICEMNDLQVVIATHSPNIVNGHFELYAERGLTDEC